MDLRGIDLNLLVTLDVLLEECHVTRSANRLALSQPAATAQLQRLRKLLADDLLVRDGRRLVRTPLAEALVEPVKDVLARVESLLEVRPTFDPATDQREFSIVASDYVAMMLVRPLLAALMAEAPNVRIRVQSIKDDWDVVLRRGEVDFILMPVTFVDEVYASFPRRELFDDDYVCAVSASHPTVEDQISRAQFSELPYARFQSNEQLSLADRGLAEAGITPHLEVTTETQISLPYLLSGTRLVALVLRRLAEAVAPSAGIKILESPFPVPPIVEALAWNPRQNADAGHTWLRERITALARTL